jgi:ABC-type iron transport system FetAB ATPase subunit
VGVASLCANVASGRIVFKPQTAASLSAAVHERLRAQVAALLRHRRGGVTLHGASVALQGVAIACIGESGVGKSTLAAHLCAHARAQLLSDDTSALRFDGAVIEVAPTERHHWLCADAARHLGIEVREQLRVPTEAARPASRAARLGAFVSLVFDERASSPVLRRIQGIEAMSALSRSTFHFAFEASHSHNEALDHAARLAREAVVFELVRPRDMARLEESSAVVAKLLEHLCRDDADW